MTVLGILQNQWAHDPAKTRATLDRQTPRNRRAMIRYMLAGSVSGRRLRAALGDAWDRITWENATPVITPRPSDRPPADLAYVSHILCDIGPDVVIALGRVAQDAVRQTGWAGTLIEGPHPASRSVTIKDELADVAEALSVAMDP